MFRVFLSVLICLAPLCAMASKPSLLEQMSDEFNQIATSATPATVFIKVQAQVEQQFDPHQDEIFKRFFGGASPFQQQQQPQIQHGSGSGFIIRADGYIVTNYHVIKDATEINVVLNDGREYPAVVKGSDPRTDLAVLKIEEKSLPFLNFGDSDKLRVGEIVIAIGNPFGLEASLTTGVVSAKGRQDLGIASFEDFIQTDAAINPGNSGGPLLNPQGEVVGVNTAILTRSGGYMGIGLSIPSKMAQNVIDQIIDIGSVRRAYLGILMQPLDKNLASALGLDKQEGLIISEVVKDSPAFKAGLLQGDIITGYNDKPIKSITKFRHDIAMMLPGTQIKLNLLRDNNPMTMNVELGSASDNEVVAGEMIQKIGIEIENINPELASKLGCPNVEGVVITNVKPGSPAAKVGLQKGFVITQVAIKTLNNQKKITCISDFDQAMKMVGDEKNIFLLARYQNYQSFYTINLK